MKRQSTQARTSEARQGRRWWDLLRTDEQIQADAWLTAHPFWDLTDDLDPIDPCLF